MLFFLGFCFAHRVCISWTEGVDNSGNETAVIQDIKSVDKLLIAALARRCKLCQHLGANVRCHIPDCDNWYHMVCSVAAGAFLDNKGCIMLCPENLNDAPHICK